MSMRIFISSAQKEFAEERAALRDFLRGDALMRRFFEPFLFEEVPAADRRADEVYLDEVERYKKEKKEIQVEAEKLEAEVGKFDALSDESNQKSAEAMHPHHQLALAMTLIQIAISLASITVLTRKIWLFWGAGIAAGIGGVLWVTAGGVGMLLSLVH